MCTLSAGHKVEATIVEHIESQIVEGWQENARASCENTSHPSPPALQDVMKHLEGLKHALQAIVSHEELLSKQVHHVQRLAKVRVSVSG